MSGLSVRLPCLYWHAFVNKSLHLLNVLVLWFSARDGALEGSWQEDGMLSPSLVTFHHNLAPSRVTVRWLLWRRDGGRVIFLLYLIIQNRGDACHGCGSLANSW